MSDLPSVISRRLQELCGEITQMRRGGDGIYKKPHKLIMLLAVLDLAEDGLLQNNRIYFDTQTISRFEINFKRFANESDWCQPGPPYFHLRTSTFWLHEVRLGREAQYAKLSTSGGGSRWILDNIEYAYLSEEAYSVAAHPHARQELRQFIIQTLERQS